MFVVLYGKKQREGEKKWKQNMFVCLFFLSIKFCLFDCDCLGRCKVAFS